MKESKILSISLSNSVVYVTYFFLFITSSIIYYYTFVNDKGFVYEPILGWINPVNIHDHYVYLEYINKISNITELFGLNNNLGISIIYYLSYEIFFVFGFQLKFEALALIVNLSILLLALKSYINVLNLFGMPRHYAITFFFMSSLIYFAQLINKDSFTIFILIKAVELAKKEKWFRYGFLAFFALFIRFQLPVLLMVYIYMVIKNKKPINTFFLLYISSSLLNGYLAKYQTNFFNEKTLSDGVSYFIYQLNLKYYIGSLLFNPLRVIQYLYDTILSFNYVNDNGEVDVSRLKNIPQLLVLILYIPFIVNCFINYKKRMHGDEKFFLAMIISFFLVWLFNPTINQRYFICILPILQLLGLQQLYKFRKDFK